MQRDKNIQKVKQSVIQEMLRIVKQKLDKVERVKVRSQILWNYDKETNNCVSCEGILRIQKLWEEEEIEMKFIYYLKTEHVELSNRKLHEE